MIYTTVQGDTWDIIAKKVYNNEMRADYLMGHNYPLLDIVIFSGNVKVNTPDLPVELPSNLPAWRR